MFRFRLDGFTILLVLTMVAASLLPCRGEAALWFNRATTAAIMLLFFMHGAKLSRQAVIGGLAVWRLHLGALSSTFLLFPLLGLGIALLPGSLVDPGIKTGIMFLCILPSTVQSSIAFTVIARGNVPAAMCSASLSNIAGVFITPALAGLLIHTRMGVPDGFLLDAIQSIALKLLLPFIAGHLSRPLIAGFVSQHRVLLGRLDRGSILLVVYTAFSASVIDGLWQRLSSADLALIAGLSTALLAMVLALTALSARFARLSTEDEIVLVFCGSKKSLASGVPMAGALFAPAQVGMMILPLMIFHQIQLIICAALAQHYARRVELVPPEEDKAAAAALSR